MTDITLYLDKLFPNPKCELEYEKDYELLIAVMLSAQTTDKRVNMVTRVLFNKYNSLESLANANLTNIIENNLKIEYQVTSASEDSVKIMTIHASKGLEYGVCYFSGLYSKFNIREAINKFSYDDNYGIIIPYKNNFIWFFCIMPPCFTGGKSF